MFHFWPFLAVSVILARFRCFFGGFSHIFWSGDIMGGHHNSNFIFGCFHFLPFLAIFGHFWAIFAFLGIFAFLSGFKRTSELYNN